MPNTDDLPANLDVHVLSLHELSLYSPKIPGKLTIPPYQRPYSWGERQVRQLLNDLRDASRERKAQPYLMGTLILCKADDSGASGIFEIVDGQQRLVTLSLLLISLDHGAQTPIREIPHHGQSLENLQDNKALIDGWRDEWMPDDAVAFRAFVTGQVRFLVITAPSLDDAFAFFDSQNSRGKPLAREDLLKAHHLRHLPRSTPMDEDDKRQWEEMERGYVRDWERLDLAKDGEQSRLRRLLHVLIGSARQYARHEFRSLDVLDEFRAQLRGTRTQDGRHFRFNRYHQPPIFTKWRQCGQALELYWDLPDGGFKQDGDRLCINVQPWRWMHFQLTQALEGGEQMFWFLKKYDELEKALFPKVMEKHCETWLRIRNAQAAFNNGEVYLKSAFDAAMLFYYDKFETEQLDLAAVHFEHFFFHLRLALYSVKGASLSKLLRIESELSPDQRIRHPFYLIEHSASPDHVFTELTESCERLWNRDRDAILDRVRSAPNRSAKYWNAMYVDASGPYQRLPEDKWAIWALKRQMVRTVTE